jgi:hypothetical protein
VSRDDEYDDWGPPVDPDETDDDSVDDSDVGAPMGEADETDLGPPSEMRDPLLRDRIRDRLGVTPQQWYVIESVLLVLPYLVFLAVYFTTNVDQTLFLTVALAYSLVAMYVGFLS